jgi:hypothetical protein
MRNELFIGLLVLAACLHVPYGIRAQQRNSAGCMVQATVVPRVTVSTTAMKEVPLSRPQTDRTAVILSGEGVFQVNIDTNERAQTTIIELKQQSKEIQQSGCSRIKRVRLEYLSS